LEGEFGAEIMTMGDAGMDRTHRRQDLDLLVMIDGELIAIEVKTRYQGVKAGKLSRSGNLPKPRMNRARVTSSGVRSSRQRTPEYAAERLTAVLSNPEDGVIETWAVVVDLRGMRAQSFTVDDRGHVGMPLRPPADCTQAALRASETIFQHRGFL
jgi:hypothetical protein